MADQIFFAHNRFANFTRWLTEVTQDPERRALALTFLYPVDMVLMISIQERGTGLYYDFSDKRFKLADKVLVPRASFTSFGDIGCGLYAYGAVVGRSAKLDGEYVITIRNGGWKHTIVALLAYVVRENQFSPNGVPVALDAYTVEVGLPAPGVVSLSTHRAGRAIELE